MSTEIMFSEKQKFNQWWLWVIILGIDSLIATGVIKQIIGSENFSYNSLFNIGFVIGWVLLLGVNVLFLTLKLETQIKEYGIYYRFFPVQVDFKKYSWDIIDKSYVRKYSPLGEFGGWGYRIGMSGSGNALNVSGNMGLQLVFINNKRLLIGTTKAEELTEVLRKLGKLGE